jgi:hypothetical protein
MDNAGRLWMKYTRDSLILLVFLDDFGRSYGVFW